ncbi:MAG: MFS transporter, partial [Lactobacillus sp.]|nr:MFS transporter [Lactobacillus sp.]
MTGKEEKLTITERLNTAKVTVSNAISKFGDVLFDYVNSVFLSATPNGGLWLSLYQSSEILVSVFFNFWGGALSDSGNRKQIIFRCDLISGLICLLLTIFIPKSLFIYAVILINIALAIITSFRSPAYKAIFREIVATAHINKVNSILEIAKEVVQIAGPGLALVIAHFFGNRMALILDAVSFFISGLLVRKLTILTRKAIKKSHKNTFSQIKEGFQYLATNQQIVIIIVFSSIVNFILAGYNLILPFSTYAFTGTTFKAYAAFLTAESIGGLLGASISTFIKKEPTTKTLLGLIILCGVALMSVEKLFQAFHSIVLIAIPIVLFNLFLSIYNIQFMTFVQTRTDINYIGRVFGIIFSVAILFMPFGIFFFQSMLNLKNPANYLILGLALIIVAVLTLILNRVTAKLDSQFLVDDPA